MSQMRTTPQSEAQLEPLVLIECGRLSQPSLYPSLLVWKVEVGAYIPKTSAFGAVDAAFRSNPRAVADDVKRQLSRCIRMLGLEGMPDIMGVVEGRSFGLELKRPAWRGADGVLHAGGEVREAQVRWHAVAGSKGLPVAIIDAVEQVEPFLRVVLTGAVAPSPARLRWVQ